jgi:hypothetical protein
VVGQVKRAAVKVRAAAVFAEWIRRMERRKTRLHFHVFAEAPAAKAAPVPALSASLPEAVADAKALA